MHLPRLLGLLLATLSQFTSCALLDQAHGLAPAPGNGGRHLGRRGHHGYLLQNFYAGSCKDRSDHRAQGGGTLVAKARAPVASGTSQAQAFYPGRPAGWGSGRRARGYDAHWCAILGHGRRGARLAALVLADKFWAYRPRLHLP